MDRLAQGGPCGLLTGGDTVPNECSGNSSFRKRNSIPDDLYWLKTPGANRTKFEAGRRDHASPTWRVGHELKAGFCRDRYRLGSRRHVDAEQRRRLRTVAAECPGPEVSIRSDVSAAAPRKVGDRRDRRDGRRQPRSHLGAAQAGPVAEERAFRGRGHDAAQSGLLHPGAAGARVRSGRQVARIMGRPRPGLRVAVDRARHLCRCERQRLAGGKRREGRPSPQVHDAGQVPGAVRPSGQERRQLRHAEPRRPRQPDGGFRKQRAVCRRRLPEPPRHRDRHRDAGLQAHVGRVRQ